MKENGSPEVSSDGYSRLTTRMAWNLAAAHTWPASILPCLIAVAASVVTTGRFQAVMVLDLLVICVLMQSAVNTFNDYFDYVKGTDSAEDNLEESDAVLVYNRVNPKAALRLAVGMLVAAFLLGIYPVAVAGWIPLAIAAFAAVIVVLYSGGKTPISYLPLGELASGLVMGGLIPLACYQVLTLDFNLLMLVWAVPTVIGVALIMFTNNTCDIEKDVEAGRNTLAVVLGRPRSKALYHGLVAAWIIAIVCIVLLWFTNGIVICVFMLFAVYPLVKVMFANPLTNPSRVAAIGQICNLNIALGAFYAAAILASRIGLCCL